MGQRYAGRVEAASDSAYDLGEGPLWDAARERVLWVDIDAGRVVDGRLADVRLVDLVVREYGETVGAVAVAEDGARLVAGARGLIVEGSDGSRTPGPRVIPSNVGSRLNEGKCDPAGRFVVGSLAQDGRQGAEVLVRIEGEGGVTVLDDDLTLSNGIAWSPDGGTLYSIDSTQRTLWTRDYEVASGRAGPRRVLIEFPGETPDGMCVDAEGCLWVAFWGGSQVRRFDAHGSHVGVLDVPALNVTSVAFVGSELDRLLITTAATGMSDEQCGRFPDAGRLFIADIGVRGLPVACWSGPRGWAAPGR